MHYSGLMYTCTMVGSIAVKGLITMVHRIDNKIYLVHQFGKMVHWWVAVFTYTRVHCHYQLPCLGGGSVWVGAYNALIRLHL